MKKKLIIYIGIIIGFLVLAYGFVPQVLGGKIINQSDISGYRGMAQELPQALLAAMSANGVSEINNIEQIDRGYEDIDTRLRALGAVITRK